MAPRRGLKQLRNIQRSKAEKFQQKAMRSRRWLTKIPERTHMFRRLGKKTIIYVSGAGTLGSAGSPSTDSGFSLTGTVGDSLTGCYQFGISHHFRLDSASNYTEFTNLFDRYKIVGVKYRIYYHCNDAPVSGLQVLPLVHYTVDTDDASAPTALVDIQDKGDCKTKILGNNQYIQVYIRPKIAGSVYRSGVTAAYDVEKAKWINASYPDVQHFGIKLWFNQVYMASSNNTAFTIEPLYYLACKDTQ